MKIIIKEGEETIWDIMLLMMVEQYLYMFGLSCVDKFMERTLYSGEVFSVIGYT